MSAHKSTVTLFVLLLTTAASAVAGMDNWIDKLKQAVPTAAKQDSSVTGLTQSEMANGLKQALDQGVNHAVAQLGQPGGFLNDARVRIPMPEKLEWIERTLRKFGQAELADEFVTSMNSAAEQAVPEVASVFGEAIRDMSLEDARGILSGPDDAATEYFRSHSSDALAERMQPIIAQATDKAGVTSHYKAMTDKTNRYSAGLLDKQSVDLDSYVTRKALDGLFVMIAEQERLIRENPMQRSTELLKKVFGAAQR